MADITAKMVNELRQRTNAPMMDTKRALSMRAGIWKKRLTCFANGARRVRTRS